MNRHFELNSYMLILLHAVQTTDNRLLHFINTLIIEYVAN